jgi:MFS family permease
MVTGITSLLLLRVVMGLAEGAFVPPAGVVAIEASKPSRRGLNYGLVGVGLPLIGLGAGPILATQLLQATGSWRIVFVIVALPGLVLAYAIYKTIRDVPTRGAAGISGSTNEPQFGWRDALRYRNVTLACLIMLCTSGASNVVIVMTPSYLVDYLKVDTRSMGFIISAIGIGAMVGTIVLPALSDRLGRKAVMLGGAIAAGLALWSFMMSPPEPVRLSLMLAAFAAFSCSVLVINVGPLTFESVPAAIASTAIGLVSGVGEILGGAMAPFLAGYIANNHGIQHVFGLALAALGLAILFIFFVREPSKASIAPAQKLTPNAVKAEAG